MSFAFLLGQQAKRTDAVSQDLDLNTQQSVAGTLVLLERLPHVVLLAFLEAWQSGDSAAASRAALVQSALDRTEGKPSSQERAAMNVLLQAAASETLEPAALAPLRQYPPWLTRLIEGEWHLKRGDVEQALAAYRRSHQALLADLVEGGRPAASYRQYIQSRLYELETGSKSGAGAP